MCRAITKTKVIVKILNYLSENGFEDTDMDYLLGYEEYVSNRAEFENTLSKVGELAAFLSIKWEEYHMPCESPYDGDYGKAEIDELTQDLCYLCANLMNAGIIEKYASNRILKWHKTHMNWDNERVTNKIKDVCKEDATYLNHPEQLAQKFINEAEAVHPVSDWHKRWFLQLTTEVTQKIKLKQENEEELEESIKAKLTKKELSYISYRHKK